MTETINLVPAIALLPVDPAAAWTSLGALAAALAAALAVIFLWTPNA